MGKDVVVGIKKPDADDLNYYRMLVSEWVGTADNDQAQKIGPAFERIRGDLPRFIKTSPSNTLYRVVLVSEEAFEKTLKGKPLTLKNRMYSSWTYSINAAYKFATRRLPEPDQVLVILYRIFQPSEIFINIIALADYAGIDWEDPQGQMIMQEQEIIVKNLHKTFKFKPSEIYQYRLNEQQDPNRDWKTL